MPGCTNWDTDPARRAAPSPAPARTAARSALVRAALVRAVTRLGLVRAAAAAAIVLAATAARARADAADLDRLLGKAIQAVDKAADAAEGRDPGKVSTLLIKADGQVEAFEAASGVGALLAALDGADAAAARRDFPGATTEIRAARGRIVRISDYIVPRRAEEAGRAALTAAEGADAAALAVALARMRAAVRADVLRARLQDARAAIARAREAMVRGDMPLGRTAIAAARAGLAGLQYAASLSRATSNLASGADLLQEEALLGARDLARRATRDLRLAVEAAPAAQRQAVEEVYRASDDLWKRMNRPREVDPASLREAAARVEAIRQEQAPPPPAPAAPL